MGKPRLAYMYVKPSCYGQKHGCGRREFTIPVRDSRGKPLSIEAIKFYVEGFVSYAANHQRTFFLVAQLACHEGEYLPSDIAPLFEGVTDNVFLPGTWEPDDRDTSQLGFVALCGATRATSRSSRLRNTWKNAHCVTGFVTVR